MATAPQPCPRPCGFNLKVAAAPQSPKLSLSLALPLPLRSSPLSLSLSLSPSLFCSTPPSPLHCSSFNHQRPHVPSVRSRSQDSTNNVSLIGTVTKPVQIKPHPTTGNLVAWTRLAVLKSSTRTTWVNLTFWNELAHVAYRQLQPGQRISVSGSLVSDDLSLYFKVVVKQIHFVQTRSSPVSYYDPRMARNSPGSVEQRWKAFFANPRAWWDNRNNKKNPNAPDFKHKDTGEALWLNSKYIPPWVNSQLEILDSKMASLQDNSRSSAVSFTDVTGS
ncbi:Single-stranded DNA-binding protein [Rhynchospora pubera]|uniref:Single-stranded DNA-binding protein n=1 Tax=Rhynchospora pubera TaxID=906938 RepID=A0AAV8CZN8_9POAL|nr:Single-stranded DNA-binding protein [Rhynchospora pubera]